MKENPKFKNGDNLGSLDHLRSSAMSPFNSVHMTSCSPFIESVYVPFPRYTVAVICKFFSYTMYIWRPDGDDLIGISAISLSSN